MELSLLAAKLLFEIFPKYERDRRPMNDPTVSINDLRSFFTCMLFSINVGSKAKKVIND